MKMTANIIVWDFPAIPWPRVERQVWPQGDARHLSDFASSCVNNKVGMPGHRK
jgi:hypothetical protein